MIEMRQPSSSEQARVLIVEDEIEIQDLIALHLRRSGWDVDQTMSGEEALNLLRHQEYDVLVLDWMLPGMSGLDITRSVREKNSRESVGIVMVTAKTDPQDVVSGLEAGADDYVTKPFDPQILKARVGALLRRVKSTEIDSDNKIRLGQLVIDPDLVEVTCKGQSISLTPSEFKLLLALAHNRGRVISREDLIREVQGDGISVVGRTVDTHIFGLRKKMTPCSEVIETVRGIGYRIRNDG